MSNVSSAEAEIEAKAAEAETAEAEPAGGGAAASPFSLRLISADDPCGPDLDLEGDADYLNFFAAIEGLLPANYYGFNRETIGFPAAFKTLDSLLERTLDIRLLILGAKLAILNRNFESFAARIGSVAWLLGAHWDEVHPRAEGGDFALRAGQLETLDDNAVSLLPLQYAPLIDAGRLGVLSYRDHLVATGAAQPRVVTRLNLRGEEETTADEKFMAPSAVDRLLRDVDIERIVGAYETARGLVSSVQAIRSATTERGGDSAAVRLEKLDGIAKGMAEFLRAALAARDPSFAPAADAEAPGEDKAGEEGAASPELR